MKALGKKECMDKYNLSSKWFYAMCLDDYFVKIGRNKYVPQEPVDVEAYKLMHKERKKERIRQSNITYANNMTLEERRLMNEKLSKAQKRWFANPENLAKHKLRQKKAMNTVTAKQNLSKACKEKYINMSNEQRKQFKQIISTAVSQSWNDLKTRQHRINGLRQAYADRKETILAKIHTTKLTNHSYGTSKTAEYCINLLKQKGYTIEIEKCYPGTSTLHCDAYIKELNMWIEFHYYWVHGKEPFDITNKEHLTRLAYYKSKYTKQYDCAVYTWSNLDVRKRMIAEQNKLNYYCFYNIANFKEFLMYNL